jgi:predicted MFS family arabinose efflux permease
LRGLSLFLLPFALRSAGVSLVFFIVFYGLDWVATVPPTAALASEAFGPETGSVVYGWIFASHQLGAAVAAYGAGAIRTWTGDYLPAFIAAGLLCLLAAVLSISIPSRKERIPVHVIPEPVPV